MIHAKRCWQESDECRLKPTMVMTDAEIAGVLDGIAAMIDAAGRELRLCKKGRQVASHMSADLRFIADGLAAGTLRYERIFPV